jgi:hypothetical protein
MDVQIHQVSSLVERIILEGFGVDTNKFLKYGKN